MNTLALKNFATMSDRAIADMCGVSNRFVSDMRPALTVNGSQLPRTGLDGKTRKMPDKPENKPETQNQKNFSSLSDRAISDLCGVNNHLVADLRQVGETPTSQKRTGRDGKSYPAPENKPETPKQEECEKGGVRVIMTTPIQAIKTFCRFCINGQQVESCASISCPLWRFRTGTATPVPADADRPGNLDPQIWGQTYRARFGENE